MAASAIEIEASDSCRHDSTAGAGGPLSAPSYSYSTQFRRRSAQQVPDVLIGPHTKPHDKRRTFNDAEAFQERDEDEDHEVGSGTGGGFRKRFVSLESLMTPIGTVLLAGFVASTALICSHVIELF
jgi:hypothetical protein